MKRPALLERAAEVLPPEELLYLRLVSKSFERGKFASSLTWLQKHVGTRWIELATSRLRHFHHFERFPKLAPNESCVLVCNHRSFFDLYVVIAWMMQYGMKQRIVFPVRANFFYDRKLGLLVNGAMSFFAMYPPMYRDRNRGELNMLGLDELSWLLSRGGCLVGFHPEGTRNLGDPYKLLPARTGVGRLVHSAKVRVVPVFTNGLLHDDLKRQIVSNFDGTGTHIHTVFGEPIDFEGLLTQPPSQSVYKRIANKTRNAIMALGAEERLLRAQAGH